MAKNHSHKKRNPGNSLYFDSNLLFYSASSLLGELDGLSWDSIIKFLTANPVLGYPILVGVASLATFLMYGWDKRQAKNNGWRVPEKQLHGLAFLGGWPGAMLGQNFFRHKTQKIEFKIMTWLAAGLHVILVSWYLYSRFIG